MSPLGIVLLIVLIALLFGGLGGGSIAPWSYGYGYGHGGVGLVGVLVVILLVLLVMRLV
jgi:hypothetical protein